MYLYYNEGGAMFIAITYWLINVVTIYSRKVSKFITNFTIVFLISFTLFFFTFPPHCHLTTIKFLLSVYRAVI